MDALYVSAGSAVGCVAALLTGVLFDDGGVTATRLPVGTPSLMVAGCGCWYDAGRGEVAPSREPTVKLEKRCFLGDRFAGGSGEVMRGVVMPDPI